MPINPEWEVSVRDVKSKFDRGEPFLLLDVREPSEHKICNIASAQLIPLGELPKRLDEIRKLAGGDPIITQCHHGGRSLAAAELLRKNGFAGVKSMAGGIDMWSMMIDPGVPRY